MAWRLVASNGTYDSVPKAGHWLGMFGLLLSKIYADEDIRRRKSHMHSKQDRYFLKRR